MNYSKVVVNGSVTHIDYAKRDLTLEVPDGDEQKQTVVIHMWKTASDGDHASWVRKHEWRNDVNVGTVLTVCGHMGNNGRVIARQINPAFQQRLNIVDLVGKIVCDDDQNIQFVTRTPLGKEVLVNLDMNGVAVPTVTDDVQITGNAVSDGKIRVNELVTFSRPDNYDDENEGDYAFA